MLFFWHSYTHTGSILCHPAGTAHHAKDMQYGPFHVILSKCSLSDLPLSVVIPSHSISIVCTSRTILQQHHQLFTTFQAPSKEQIVGRGVKQVLLLWRSESKVRTKGAMLEQ